MLPDSNILNMFFIFEYVVTAFTKKHWTFFKIQCLATRSGFVMDYWTLHEL